jgi:transcription initiation factor TFIIIB Brf1 subunit/transcription initiation factor TFIIB
LIERRRKTKSNVDYNDVRSSIRDLAVIYKPSDPKRFVAQFVYKYNVQKGYEAELEQIVRDVLHKGSEV